MAANNEDTTRADERAEETAAQAVTQTAADTAAGLLFRDLAIDFPLGVAVVRSYADAAKG